MDVTATVEEALGRSGVAALPAEGGREPPQRQPRPRPKPRLQDQRPLPAEPTPSPAVNKCGATETACPSAAETTAGRAGKPRRRLKVADLLREEGWTLKRRVKHYVYTKVVRRPDGTSHRLTYTMASTPSTKNHDVVQRATLRRLQRTAEELRRRGWCGDVGSDLSREDLR
jgi:hypothetical protein